MWSFLPASTQVCLFSKRSIWWGGAGGEGRGLPLAPANPTKFSRTAPCRQSLPGCLPGNNCAHGKHVPLPFLRSPRRFLASHNWELLFDTGDLHQQKSHQHPVIKVLHNSHYMAFLFIIMLSLCSEYMAQSYGTGLKNSHILNTHTHPPTM